MARSLARVSESELGRADGPSFARSELVDSNRNSQRALAAARTTFFWTRNRTRGFAHCVQQWDAKLRIALNLRTYCDRHLYGCRGPGLYESSPLFAIRCCALLFCFFLPPVVNGFDSEVNLDPKVVYLLNIASKEHIPELGPEFFRKPLGDLLCVTTPQQFGLGQDENGISLLAQTDQAMR